MTMVEYSMERFFFLKKIFLHNVVQSYEAQAYMQRYGTLDKINKIFGSDQKCKRISLLWYLKSEYEILVLEVDFYIN